MDHAVCNSNQRQYLKLKSVEMQDVAETLEGETASAHPTGLDLSAMKISHA